jgi:hypothetical protein
MPLSHIVLHVALCNSALRRRPGTELPVHVTVTNRVHNDVIDDTYRVVRENGNVVPISFVMPWGEYRVSLRMKSRGITCSAMQYFAVAPGQSRAIDMSIEEHPKQLPTPLLVYGSAPFAFSYVQPTVLVFEKNTQCNAPVGNPLDMDIVTQNDADGYYASVYPRPELVRREVVVAVRLTDSRGDYHYIRVPSKMMYFSSEWPSVANVDVNDAMIDFVAGKPEDTLLCPRFYSTITH